MPVFMMKLKEDRNILFLQLAGARIILLRLNITQWWIHILLGTAIGLAFSVLAAVIAKKVKCLNFFFFPAKAYALKKELHRNSKSQ